MNMNGGGPTAARLRLCKRGLPSGAHQVVGGSQEVEGSQDSPCFHAGDKCSEYKSQSSGLASYYSPGPKNDLLEAKFNVFIQLVRGHIAPYVWACSYIAEQFRLNKAQLSAIYAVGRPTVIAVLLGVL